MNSKLLFDGKHYKYLLFMLFIIVWLWSLWYPTNEKNWFLENKIVFISIPFIYAVMVRYIRFSKISLTLVTIFIILHTIGAHYNYGSVPFGQTLGGVLGIHQNIYDKFVHFCFGLLIMYPLREFFLRVAQAKGFWGYLYPFMAILTLGVFYEIFEWVTVLQYDPQVGYLFIGGNDPFDTTKDLFSAMLGALVTLSLLVILERHRSKPLFKRKMKESFTRDQLSYPKEDEYIHKKLE